MPSAPSIGGSSRTAREARSASWSARVILSCSCWTGRAISGASGPTSMPCASWACTESRRDARSTTGAASRSGARSIRPLRGRSFWGCRVPDAVTTSGSTSDARLSLTRERVCTARTLGPSEGSRPVTHQPGPEVLSRAVRAFSWASASVLRAPAWSPEVSWPENVWKSEATAWSAVRAFSAW